MTRLANKFFDIKTKTKPSPEIEEGNGFFVSKYLLAHYQKIKGLEKDLPRCPEREEFFFLQTDSAFNAFTFIPFVGRNESIKHLFASTYSISRRTIEALVEMHDKGVIEEITLMISDSMRKRNPVTMDLLFGLANTRANLHVQFAWVHAKVCLMQTMSGNYIVEGSGNWSENAHYEQYVFANSKKLYEFRKELFTTSKLR
jgi:hypothetical protein